MSRLKMSVRLSGGPPWGFRLEGKTVDHPNLQVSKVRAKSKSYNIVKEGDFVICINGIPTKELTYDQVMDMLDGSGYDLTLDLLRVRPVTEDSHGTGCFESVIPQPSVKMEDEIAYANSEIEIPGKGESEEEVTESDSEEENEPISNAITDSKLPNETAAIIIPQNKNAEESDEEISDEDLTSSVEESSYEEEEDEEDENNIDAAVIADPQKNVKNSDGFQYSPHLSDISEPPREQLKMEKSPEHLSANKLPSDHQHHSAVLLSESKSGSNFTPQTMFEINKPSTVVENFGVVKEAAGIINDDHSMLSLPSTTAVATIADAVSTNEINDGPGLGVPTTLGKIPKVGAFEDDVGGGEEHVETKFQCQIKAETVDESGLADSSNDLDGSQNLSYNGFDEYQSPRQQVNTMDSTTTSGHPMFKVSKIVGRSQTWTPSTGYVRPSEIISKYQSTNVWKRTRPTDSNGRGPRPKSMPVPPVDIQIDKASEEVRNGRACSEETDSAHVNGYSDSSRLMKIIQPPEPIIDDMDVLISRKKMFSSSSFYEEPMHIYPTVEEQVELCKKIANSLSSDTNVQSKGASMYNKRKKRADKWVFEGPDPCEADQGRLDYSSSPDVTNYSPNSYRTETTTTRKLKLVLDPRQLQDATRLRHLGLYNEHNLISPEICFDLVKDLNSPTGKGAALFAKRKKKSEKWVVDENTVKQHEQLHLADETTKNIVNYHQPQTPLSHLEAYENLISHRRLKLIKSPWEAALESPIGCCDAAFQEVEFKRKLPSFGSTIATTQPTVIQRTEEQSVISPVPTASSSSPYTLLEPPTASLSASPISNTASHLRSQSFSPNYGRFSTLSTDVYKPKAPKGWGGHTIENSSVNLAQEAPSYLDVTNFERTMFSPGSNFDNSQFTDFNSKARVWEPGELNRSKSFKSVRPPSLIF